MKYESTKIKDCVIIHLQAHRDNRGVFYESYNHFKYLDTFQNELFYEKDKGNIAYVLRQSRWHQTNCSTSTYGVVRGIHIAKFAKLVSCLYGHVWDVVVDMRKDSPTYLQWIAVDLIPPDKINDAKQVYVPPGCGHGFFSFEDGSTINYMQTATYDPKVESSINWRDPALAIDWPCCHNYILSEKDLSAPMVDQ